MPLSNRSLRLLGASAVALAIAGCATVGPDFKPAPAPQGAAAAGYAMPGDPAPAGVRMSPEARGAGPWWQAFGSPELDQAVRQALADSPSVAEAAATLAKAQAELAAARGDQQPQVDALANAQRERINTQAFGFSFPGLFNPTISLFQIGASVTYDLDLFGGKRRATEAAGARAQAEGRRADAAYLALSGNVALQAMRIAALRAQIATVQDIIAADTHQIDILRKAQVIGGEARSSLSTAIYQLAEDQALLPPLQRDLAAARHQMALLSGRSPADYVATDFDMAKLTLPGEIPVSLPSELIRRRPDIAAAEAELHAATADIGVAVANQYPNISLSARLTQGALKPDKIFDYASSGWSLLGGATAPIFDGGRLKGERRAAEAEARAALARYQQTVLRAFAQVSDVLAALASDQQAIASLSAVNHAADVALRDNEASYRLGGGPLINVVQAQRTVSRARRALVEAQGRRLADMVELYAATATDWRAAP